MTETSFVRTPTEFSLGLKYTQREGEIYLGGIHAIVRLSIDQHRADKRRRLNTATLFAGYPGSPLGGLDLELKRQQKLLKEHQIHHISGINEDLAATAILGSQMMHRYPFPKYDAVLGMWYGKSPGVDRSGDALRHGNMMGVGKNGSVLVLAGDDPTSKSSTIPSDSSGLLVSTGMPILLPGNVQDILDLGLHGFMLSRSSGLWVACKIVTNVADGAGTAEVSPDRINPVMPEMDFDGRPFVPEMNLDAIARSVDIVEAERVLYDGRLEMARLYAWENDLNRITVPTHDAWLGIVAAGKSYYDMRQALAELGLNDAALECYGIRILKLGMVWPVEPRIIREFTRGLREVLVVEEKRSLVETAIKEVLYGLTDRPVVVGKRDETGDLLLPLHGELDSDLIARAIGRRLAARGIAIPSVESRIRYLLGVKPEPPLTGVQRIPYFCSGCPHNSSIRLPQGSIVGAGIGCHTMIVFVDPEIVGEHCGLIHMGGEGSQWVGLAPFTGTPHMFQNMGDGTFFHSGSMSIRFAVSAGVNMTFKILYNHVVAMTGGQEPVGVLRVPDLTRLLQAEGVKKIIVTTDYPANYKGVSLAKIAEVWHRDRMLEAQTTLAAVPGVTVLIHDQQCALERRRRWKRGLEPELPTRVYINQRVCEGCGDCGRKSNCLSVHPVETEFGHKVHIHQSSCNKDYSCLRGDCPSFITVDPGDGGRVVRHHHPFPNVDLPEPEAQVPTDSFQLYMVGIGGTGVVTVNQIMGTAALLDGKHIRSLDQTGLAQKGGPVVSHLKTASQEMDVSNSISAGKADVYLAFELLAATQPHNLAKADPERTIAVVSTSKIPTGEMVTDNTVTFPDVDAKVEEIRQVAAQGKTFCLDAEAMAEAFFGEYLAANNIILGAAYQLGAIPISMAAIEKAVQLNGVAVEMNLSAFRWGRLAVVDPGRVKDELERAQATGHQPMRLAADAQSLVESVGATTEVRRLIEKRLPELIAYQDLDYAHQYVDFVNKVRQAEEEKTPGQTRITEAVARYLFKLMAYKDEYEVARLVLDPEFRAEVTTKFGEKARVFIHLDPPILRDRGLKGKFKLGPRFIPGLKLLGAMKRLRGTPLDPFGHSAIRRTERALIGQYRQMMETALAKLTKQNYDTVVAIAQLPDRVRGYEQIKMASVGPYREMADRLLEQLQ